MCLIFAVFPLLPLSPRPARRALFEKRRCSFRLVGGSREPPEDLCLDLHGVFDLEIATTLDGLDGCGDGERSHGDDGGSQFGGSLPGLHFFLYGVLIIIVVLGVASLHAVVVQLDKATSAVTWPGV